MRIAIMQPYFFPYIGYFQLINAADKFIILDDVNFINRGWINRNRILVNGADKLFTMPLKDASQNKLIKDIEILADRAEKEKMVKTIEFAYKKAPLFSHAFPLLQQIIFQEDKNLSYFLYKSLVILNEYLGIKTEIVRSSSVYGNADLKGQEKILDICTKENAYEYINPIGGTELYDKQRFAEKNIALYFLKSGEIQYLQFKNEFIPWLSIIDVIMFNPVPKIQEYLKRYTLQ